MSIKRLTEARMRLDEVAEPYVPKVQLQAAGCLIYACDTEKFLIGFRSSDVTDGACWCGFGGKIDPEDAGPSEAAIREISEEVGYNGPIDTVPLLTYNSEELRFFNFLGRVPNQFTPVLNWESDGYVWVTLEDLLDQSKFQPRHYGLSALLDDVYSLEVICNAKALTAPKGN